MVAVTARVLPMRRRGEPLPEWTDEALAAACATGDPRAVAELYERFRRPVYGFVRRAVRTDAEAEDMLQETFTQVARGLARYEGRSAVRTWIFGIAANVIRHHRRSFARRRRLADALRLVERPRPIGPGELTESRRSLARAKAALEALPVEQRLAFIMCEIEGLSASEAGRALGVGEAAVWKRVSRARARIRRSVEEGADAV